MRCPQGLGSGAHHCLGSEKPLQDIAQRVRVRCPPLPRRGGEGRLSWWAGCWWLGREGRQGNKQVSEWEVLGGSAGLGEEWWH